MAYASRMILTRWVTSAGFRWKLGDQWLSSEFTLADFLSLRKAEWAGVLGGSGTSPDEMKLVTPVEDQQEVWASGVTYLRSRVEREAESSVADVYAKVYAADRPELFFKALGWRTVGHGDKIRIRKDSDWNVPEPELTLVINQHLEIVGYAAGNDVSSRAIEGENPLYLPQAKSYTGSCAVGLGIHLVSEGFQSLPIGLTIIRDGEPVFEDETNTNQMKRKVEELVAYLGRELSFPHGVFLMTGTGIVPAAPFTLLAGDVVRVSVGEVFLENEVTG